MRMQVMHPSKGTPMEHADVVCVGSLPHDASDAEGAPLKRRSETLADDGAGDGDDEGDA